MVATRRHLIGFEVPFPACSDHRVLADAEQACGLPAPDQLGAADQIGRRCGRIRLDVLLVETMVPSRRGFDRHEGPPRYRTENSRLADAQALGRLPRTDQSVQDVCRTNAAL